MNSNPNTEHFVVSERGNPVSAFGASIVIHTWSGSGPEYMHVHHSDDEAWYVIEGTLTFKLGTQKKVVKAGPGTTVFVPAGTAHTYFEADGATKYLIILTPRLDKLIGELHGTPYKQHGDVMKKYDSEIVS